MTITLQESIESLRRAQDLLDRGIIGQAYGSLADLQEGRACFCAVGAILADRVQPEIHAEDYIQTFDWTNRNQDGDPTPVYAKTLVMTDHSSKIERADEIISYNDEDELSFGQIADNLELILSGGVEFASWAQAEKEKDLNG